MRTFGSSDLQIKKIISRSFVYSSIFTLIIALVGSIYFNRTGLQILQKNNLKREQELLSSFLVPSVEISDVTETRRLLSLASDSNEKFAVLDGSGNVLISNYEDFYIVQAVHLDVRNGIGCQNVKTGYQVIRGKKFGVSCSPLISEDISKKHIIGTLISFSTYSSSWFSPLIFYFFGVAVISLILNSFWVRKVLEKNLLKPLTKLGARVIEIAGSPFNLAVSLKEVGKLPYEINEIKNAFQKVLIHLRAEYQRRTKIEKKSALVKQAAQVAHDIRSPIASMEISLHVLSEQKIPGEQLSMLRAAVQSVRDIANNLLNQYRADLDFQEEKNHRNGSNPVSIYRLISEVVAQKRNEWLKESCELIFNCEPEMMLLQVEVTPEDVKRMISNLLNNAREACESFAKIEIQLNKRDQSLEVLITDNGVGMPDDEIKYFLDGKSTKHAGQGFGLSSASQYMKSISGSLILKTQVNFGTTICLVFAIWNPADQVPIILKQG